MIRLAWGALLIAGLAACGSSSKATSSNGGGSADGGAGATGGTGGFGGSGGGGLSVGGAGLGAGGGGTCNTGATVRYDGIDATGALLSDFQIAPSPNVSLCWYMPGDELSCSHYLTIVYDDFSFGAPVAATAVLEDGDGATLTSEPGFTVTFEDTPQKSVPGIFAGTVTDGNASYPVEGTFEGCPYATD